MARLRQPGRCEYYQDKQYSISTPGVYNLSSSLDPCIQEPQNTTTIRSVRYKGTLLNCLCSGFPVVPYCHISTTLHSRIYSLISPSNPLTCIKFALNGVTLVYPCATAHPSFPGSLCSTLSYTSLNSGAHLKCLCEYRICG
jgi:hypothetical protein